MRASYQHHPSALRNRGVITEALADIFLRHRLFDPTVPPPTGHPVLALEVASGSGAHIEVFAAAFKAITWQPSEYVARPEDTAVLKLIDSFGCEKFPNVRRACALDLNLDTSSFHAGWPPEVTAYAGQFSFVFASNLTHITPLQCTHGLLEGASKALCEGGLLCVYGPFKSEGRFTGDGGNEQFDKSLREQCPEWGYRDIEYVAEYALRHEMVLQSKKAMPANNFLLCLKKIVKAQGQL